METMRVWLGCLECYNGGKLVGRWIDLEDVADMTTGELHAYAGLTIAEGTHEELHGFDTENVPDVFGEISPNTAGELAYILESVPEHELDAFVTWCAYQFKDDIASWLYDDFESAYRGEYEDMKDFAYEEAEEAGIFSSLSEELHGYFDMDGYATHLENYYTALELPDGGVAVFRD